MPRPMVTSQMTTAQVAKELSMKTGRVVSWVEHGVLPPPSFKDENGVRYFDQKWLNRAKDILERKGMTDTVSGS